jgi:hypothetical protein
MIVNHGTENLAQPLKGKNGWLQLQFYGFFLSSTACALAYLLIAVWNQPLPAAWIAAGVIGWLLFGWARLNRWGVVLWCLAAAALCTALGDMLNPASDVAATQLLIPIGLLSSTTSAIIFLVAGVKNQAKRGRNIAGVTIVIGSLIFFAKEASSIRAPLSDLEAIQQTTKTLLDLHRLGNEVEAFRVKFGRIPQSEEEFVQCRGKPMPPFQNEFRYHYCKQSDDQYHLSCCVSGAWGRDCDIFGYILLYYGPAPPPRIDVELF